MLKNIEACQKIAEIVKTSLGPNGENPAPFLF
jgi:chaperonin GroEL (HSP60 family)